MALLERVQADMMAAMKAKEEAPLNAIRMIDGAANDWDHNTIGSQH